jgi:hypothetical protein
MNLLGLAKSKDPAFISTGFRNWNKGPMRFEGHQKCDTHHLAVSQLSACKQIPVNAQLFQKKLVEQECARRCLHKVFTSVRFLLGQGLAFRGHSSDSGNFSQLLKLQAEYDSDLRQYLSRDTNFISPQGQEEIMQLFSHSILRQIVKDIDGPFGVIVDGTQDISGCQQESICIRHVDKDLIVSEDFIGLYQVSETTGEALSKMILDVFMRLPLFTSNLRAQTYDGASAMSGKYNGCQAHIKAVQPLALFFHCGAHMSNLVLQTSVQVCALLRDSIQWVHELGVLFKRSGKLKVIYETNLCAQ